MLTILLLFKDWGSTYTQKANKDTHWPHKHIRKRGFFAEKIEDAATPYYNLLGNVNLPMN